MSDAPEANANVLTICLGSSSLEGCAIESETMR